MTRTMHFGWLVSLLTVVSLGANGREIPLIEAAKNADAKAVQAELQRQGNANVTEVDGTTALHWAVNRSDLATVDVLVKAGANVDAANRYGVTPLSLAAENGNAAVAERLLKAGAKVNLPIAGGETPLMTAARTGNVATIKTLLAHGADVNARESTRQQTALMWAAVAGNAGAIKTLIEAGADIQARSSSPSKVRGRGMAYAAPPQATDAKAAYQASLLSANGTDIAIPRSKAASSDPPYGALTALAFAVRRGQLEAARALLDGGANVNDSAVVFPKGYGPSSVLCLAIENGHYGVAKFLLERGADPNAARQGWGALHQLARARAEFGKSRLNGGWVLAPTPTGNVSGLDLARMLIAAGANVNQQATEEFEDYYRRQPTSRIGGTPLLFASRVSDSQLMKILLDAGADVSIPTIDGVTPIMAAGGVALRTAGEDAYDPESPQAVKLLLDTGRVDVNAADKDGWTPLHGAALRGVLPVIQMLVDAGAKLDAKAIPEKGRNGKARLAQKDYAGSKVSWLPVEVADGIRVTWTTIFLQQPDAAKLLRKLMAERGLPIPADEGMKRGAVAIDVAGP